MQYDIYGQPQGQGESWPMIQQALKDALRGVSYYPYDLIGAPVDIINMALTPVGLGSKEPVLGSEQLRRISQSLGFAQPSTGSAAETAGRFAGGFINPAAGARAVGQAGNLVTKGANISADKLVQMITRNPEATAARVVDETSMPFMQAVAPKTTVSPSLVEPSKSKMGFYSQLEAATIPLQNKGTGQQYLAQIQKSAGVKPEEIKWTGLDDFLAGKDSVTKQEIQDYLQANRVDVQELVMQDYTPSRAEILEFMKTERGKGLKYHEAENELYMDKLGSGPSFPEYQLPGGKNYREILLTLPQPPEAKMFRDLEMRINSGERLKPEELQQYRDLADSKAFKGQFFGEHFRNPNILAHMRVNDRTVGGKKTLFIEEIQSDWHQAGRKQGYQQNLSQDDVKNLLANEGYDVNYNGVNWVVSSKTGGVVPNKLAGGESNSQFAGNLNQVAAMVLGRRDLMPSTGSGVGPVPDAPFKTSWHELALKRAIQEASEKGYDQIAFTTGRTQAKRFDLEDASGMKGFYDNILPKSLEKLGKKFDAKVGKTKVGGVQVWQMDITPQMRESVTTKGQPLFAVPAVGAGLLGAGMTEEQY